MNKIFRDNVICLINKMEWRITDHKEIEIAPHVFLGSLEKSNIQAAINAIDDKYNIDHTWVSFCNVYARLNHADKNAPKDLLNMGTIISERICALIGICCGFNSPEPLYLFRYNDDEMEGFSAELLLSERSLRSGLYLKTIDNYILEPEVIDFLKNAWVLLKYNQCNEEEPLFNPLSNAVKFYIEACNADTMEEGIIHLAIVLESLFAPIDSHSELSHQISINICKFLSESPEERKEIYTRIKAFYKSRSQIIHGSKLKGKKEIVLFEGFKLVADCLRKILEETDIAKTFVNNAERKHFLTELTFS